MSLSLVEREKRIPRNKHITLGRIIKDEGYYDINNNWNSILTFNEYPGKIFRGRVEVLILNKNSDIFMVHYQDSNYRIPGGGIERFRSHKFQVEREAKEEALIELGKIIPTGVSYFRFFNKKYEGLPIHWDGTYNEVYIAYFKNWYYGNIPRKLRDDAMYRYGKFVPFEKAVNILNEHHKKALKLI